MNFSQPLDELIADVRAWTAGTAGAPGSWSWSLAPECLATLEQFVQQQGTRPRKLEPTRLGKNQLQQCHCYFEQLRATLNSGRGFAIVEGLPTANYGTGELQSIYWAMGQLLGIPFEQNIQGDLLYDVLDTGQNVAQGARFSVTNAESSFHLDNSFSPQVPDFVGLLCLRTARQGGQSQLISAYALHDQLLRHHPDVLETLYGAFYFDRRGQFAPGEPAALQAPIFHWDGCELSTRYLHYYIQVGHQQSDQPLSSAQRTALEVVENQLQDPQLRIEFSLEPGQMLFVNNHWILHNRTAFEDHPEPERRRHYVRLWLNREEI